MAKVVVLEEMLDRLSLVAEARGQGLHESPAVRRGCENVLIGVLRERTLDKELEAVVVSEGDLAAEYAKSKEK